MSKLIDIWARLIASSTYVIWTKARLLYLKVKWTIEDELTIKSSPRIKPRVKRVKKVVSKSKTTHTIPKDLKPQIIQRENGFI